MRTLTSDLATAIAQGTTTLARIWRITKPDSTIVRLTDNVTDINIGDEEFVAAVGFTASAIYISSLPGSAQSAQIVCATADLGVSQSDIRSGKLTGAPAQMSIVDYTNPTGGEMILMNGLIGRIQVTNRQRATVEILPRTALQINICNEVYSVSCRNSLGDSLCTVQINNFKTLMTVETLSSRLLFTVDQLANQADNYFSLGHVIWQGGANDGWISDVRIALANLTVALFYPPPVDIAVGDQGLIYPGCDLQASTCQFKFNNLNNFRAEPYRPQWQVVSASSSPAAPGTPAAPGGGGITKFLGAG